jgi:hypothetical protein
VLRLRTGAVKKCWSSWDRSGLGNNLREFLFKFRNNYLALNNRVNAFDPDVDPRCTFCRIRDPQTATRESFKHIFYECPITANIISTVWGLYFDPPGSEDDKLLNVWFGIRTDNATGTKTFNNTTSFFWDAFRYVIYKYKLSRKIPNYVAVDKELCFLINTTIFSNLGIRASIVADPALARLVQALG